VDEWSCGGVYHSHTGAKKHMLNHSLETLTASLVYLLKLYVHSYLRSLYNLHGWN